MMVVPDFTFEIKPVVVRKKHTKRNDFANHHLAHGIEVTPTFGKISDASGMSFFAAMPYCIQMDAKSGFRASVVHEPNFFIIIKVLPSEAKRIIFTAQRRPFLKRQEGFRRRRLALAGLRE
jgi:hypothetical protein